MKNSLNVRSIWTLLVLLITPVFLSSTVLADTLSKPVNQTSKGIAVKGYDMVAYFVDSRPSKGDKTITHDWGGAIWRFTNMNNRDLFIANPQKYAPQYGGYCAYGVSQGATVSFNPKAWTIVDDKLYLNLSKRIQKKWGKDIPGYINSANQKWPGLIAAK